MGKGGPDVWGCGCSGQGRAAGSSWTGPPEGQSSPTPVEADWPLTSGAYCLLHLSIERLRAYIRVCPMLSEDVAGDPTPGAARLEVLQILGLLCTPALLSHPYKNSFFFLPFSI